MKATPIPNSARPRQTISLMESPLRNSTTPIPTRRFHYSSSAITTALRSSSFLKTVYLTKWWLIHTQSADSNHKRLGVGGFTFREGQGIRTFHSAAISKRHDIRTIETANGVMIHLTGFFDVPWTCRNGFPYKVYNLFRFGFPYDWEEYATQNCGEESNKDDSHPLPTSFDDIPATQVRELIMASTSDSEQHAVSRIILNDILRKCDNYDSSKNTEPNFDLNDRTVTEIPRDHSYKESSKKLDNTSRPSVATRGMKRRKLEKTLSSAQSSAVSSGVSEPFCEPQKCSSDETRATNKNDVVATDLIGEMGIKGNHNKAGVKEYREDLAIFSRSLVKGSGRRICSVGEETKVEKRADSALRRSKRKKELVDVKQ